MPLYAGRSVGYLYVDNFKGGTESAAVFYGGVPAQLEVWDLNIQFRIDIEYHDHPHFDNGKGRFKVWLDVATTSGWTQVGYAEKDLGNDHDDDDWYDSLTLEHTMQDPMVMYRVRIECRTKQTSPGTSADTSRVFTCVQAIGYIGDFTLDFIPLSIVYCPPGQDMTNSLSQRMEFATQFTVGNSRTMQAAQGVHAGGSLWGIISFEEGIQESQSVTNTAQNSLRTSFFRNSVVTADNQRAIGRAYWGPLGDLFVILVNPKFSASRRADGTIFYEHKNVSQVIVVPAHKLLRPGNDPIASSIPQTERRKLLELDPFITNIDRFFPDAGADLKEAANPYADPSANDRAECIGMWHMSIGTELNYSIGDSIELRQATGSEIAWTTTMRGSASVIIGGSFSASTTVGIQWSYEASQLLSKTASCYLIKNQNESDLDGIKIYYDKNFSTLMFRKVRNEMTPVVVKWPDLTHIGSLFPDIPPEVILEVLMDILSDFGLPPIPRPKKWVLDLALPDLGIPRLFPSISPNKWLRILDALKSRLIPNKSLAGVASDGARHPVFYEDVELYIGNESFYRTQTDGNGEFRFDNIIPGNYVVRIGNKNVRINVANKDTYTKPKTVQITNVKRIIDPRTCPRWKFRELLGISSERLDILAAQLKKLRKLDQFAKAAGLSDDQLRLLQKRVSLPWIKAPRTRKQVPYAKKKQKPYRRKKSKKIG